MRTLDRVTEPGGSWGVYQGGEVIARILTVCSGNICRSPMAAALLRSGLEELGIDVTSAGTIAENGRPMTREIIGLLEEQGVRDTSHSSRFMTERVLAETDLVLAMTREHQHAVIKMLPSLAKRTFTLVEFPLMARQHGMTTLRDAAAGTASIGGKLRIVARVVARQPALQKVPSQVDIVDPYLRDDTVHQAMAEQLVPAAADTISVLRDVLSSSSVPPPYEFDG